MTTNVRDSISHVLAADSRWSVTVSLDETDTVLFVDDADYQKILSFRDGVFMFAGDSQKIDNWKFAMALANNYPAAVNWESLPTTGLTISCVEKLSGNVRFEINHSISLDACSFAGSGASHAANCWAINRDAVTAVCTAISQDLYSGGEVRYYRLLTDENNIGIDRSLSALGTALAERGSVMNTATRNQPIPIQEAVKNDHRLRAVVDDIAKGKITATAPHSNMNRIWSSDEKTRLVKAMEHFFPKK